MVNKELFDDYLKRAKLRFRIVNEYLNEKDYADVIRTCQEIVELVQKSILIKIGIKPPKWHEVIDIILENREKLPEEIIHTIVKLRKDSKWLRSQREIAFYGEMDFIPTKDYTLRDAKKAMNIAKRFLDISEKIHEF
ncbi:HEPN domain-containing protein [Thermodesulfovibrio yellowstonii]|uniref:HEPN domain-containing protein n=1 Tax=Thermodesulfovibrio yellowstonii TaxID=28262 RepID=UPI0024B38B7D|nr:HEPN domain-containing protein [Thermodesulfovibrio yellowstonii]MDI6865126.1 HEPN domain-containing protein [Thermodesulfovibrio yellowstonii]